MFFFLSGTKRHSIFSDILEFYETSKQCCIIPGISSERTALKLSADVVGIVKYCLVFVQNIKISEKIERLLPDLKLFLFSWKTQINVVIFHSFHNFYFLFYSFDKKLSSFNIFNFLSFFNSSLLLFFDKNLRKWFVISSFITTKKWWKPLIC